MKKTVSEGYNGKPSKADSHRFAIQFDLTYKGNGGKQMDQISSTIPDLNLTVRQLLENHTRGINDQTQVRQPLYFDIKIPTIKDMTDVDNFKNYLEEQLRSVKEFINNDINDAERKREEQNKKDDTGVSNKQATNIKDGKDNII